ncbi:uncharacterized protein LOC144548890, partial [Carex rostrata]
MDGYAGYNQIKMDEADQKHTAFRTPIGVYCYMVMPFSLKNAGATYQRAMTKIFDDLIHKIFECYVDDLVVKAMTYEEHLENLRIVFDRLRLHALKLNPLKCAFMVSSGKFLGFVVRHRGIEIDPGKIKAIMDLPPPQNLKQLRSFQGRLAYIRRFIANLSGKIQQFTRLTKKNVPFKWDSECQIAFERVKQYLLRPPVLAAPIPGKPLILYTTALEGSLGALLAQENKEGKENALYYLSRMLVGAESNYTPIEKHCLALVFAIKKLRHYMLSHKVTLVSRVDPIRYLMTRPMLTGRLAKWAIILTEFDITYVPQKAIKGQALADFLAEHPISDDSPLACEFPDEEIMSIEENSPGWELYFDGASSIRPVPGNQIPRIRAGIGLVFVTPTRGIIRHSLALTEPCTNNEAEYEALIAELEIAVGTKIKKLKIFGDSQLIINQVLGDYKVLKPELMKYHNRVIELMQEIPDITYGKITRASNGKADALARIAKELCEPEDDEIHISIKNKRPLAPCLLNQDQKEVLPQGSGSNDTLSEVAMVSQEKDWRQPFVNFLKSGILPEEKSAREQIKKQALRYIYDNDTLYRRSYENLWLRCVSKEEALQIMKEIHSGECEAHQSGPRMCLKIKRTGYYWPSMVADCQEYAKRCHQCQIHGDFIHKPPNPLHPTVASWPFDAWGTDIVGPIDPPSSE